MKPILISIIVALFILMGVSDALKDNGVITFSKNIEAFYLGILYLIPVILVKKKIIKDISIIHYFLCLGILHQSIVNITYGIVRDGISWWYIGTTSNVDVALNWLINEGLKAPQQGFLFWYYLIPSTVAIFVLYRNALKTTS